MVIRPSIEKWSRQELEDHYHVLYQQHHSLKRSYNELESKLKQSNAKLKRMFAGGNNCSNDISNAELIKENQLLTNKLKNLKQQILNYARPGTSTQRSLPLQARPPVQRPQSALPRRSNPPQQTVTASTSFIKNTQQRPATDLSAGSNRKSMLLDKTLFVKLNLELKQKDDECALLTCKLNNVQQQLAKLKDEYDQLLEQFQSKQHDGLKLQQQFDELSLSTATDKIAAKQLKNVQIMEKELEMIREENKMLLEANEKLVQNSLTIEQLAIEEGKCHETISNQRVIELEKQLNESFVKYSQLKQNYQNLMQAKLKLEERLSHQIDRIIKEKTAIDEISERKDEFKQRKLNGFEETEKLNETDISLVKIYEDLTRIIEAHIVERSTDDDSNATIERQEHIDKWRMLYMEIYGELEKVRNMLLIQHNINEQHLQEIALLNQNLQQTKAQSECKIKDLVVKLSERDAEITNLEMRLKTLAYDDQMLIPRITVSKQF
uniref:C2-C2_1 domain-containing protein n=1 Tax=Elaeophora elaphi TaxID=1147741 RepID=A0A0R3RI10_9BILA